MKEPKPFEIGDRVMKYTNFPKRKISRDGIWEVYKIYSSPNCESGWLMDVYIDRCACCGRAERKMIGYDSHWFVKA